MKNPNLSNGFGLTQMISVVVILLQPLATCHAIAAVRPYRARITQRSSKIDMQLKNAFDQLRQVVILCEINRKHLIQMCIYVKQVQKLYRKSITKKVNFIRFRRQIDKAERNWWKLRLFDVYVPQVVDGESLAQWLDEQPELIGEDRLLALRLSFAGFVTVRSARRVVVAIEIGLKIGDFRRFFVLFPTGLCSLWRSVYCRVEKWKLRTAWIHFYLNSWINAKLAYIQRNQSWQLFEIIQIMKLLLVSAPQRSVDDRTEAGSRSDRRRSDAHPHK